MGLKTKLAMGLIASATGAAMMAGGTFALFSATANNDANTFTAGTVALSAGSAPAFASTSKVYTNLAPGDTGSSTFSVENTGKLSEYVGMNVQELANSSDPTGTPNIFADQTANDNATASGGSGDANPLSLSISVTNSAGATVAGDTVPVGGSTGSTPEFVWTQAPGTTDTVTVTYNWSSSAGNDYQGASGVANFNLQAVQARNNGEANSGDLSTANSTPTSWG